MRHSDDLIATIARIFPAWDAVELTACGQDFDALIGHVAAAHDLTPAETSELIEVRLPALAENLGEKLRAA